MSFSILIIGSRGTLENQSVKSILIQYLRVKLITVLSWDEQKQYHMPMEFPVSEYP
jgi:FlaA1/EpsC-like NDP-sugar epimerase